VTLHGLKHNAWLELIEALVRVHGSNQQKELLTRKEGDERQRGHKVLVQLANNPTRVLQIVEDLRGKGWYASEARARSSTLQC